MIWLDVGFWILLAIIGAILHWNNDPYAGFAYPMCDCPDCRGITAQATEADVKALIAYAEDITRQAAQ